MLSYSFYTYKIISHQIISMRLMSELVRKVQVLTYCMFEIYAIFQRFLQKIKGGGI